MDGTSILMDRLFQIHGGAALNIMPASTELSPGQRMVTVQPARTRLPRAEGGG